MDRPIPYALCQAAGDLSFKVGDRIELLQRTESAEDWWTGKINGAKGVFPGKLSPGFEGR